MRILALLLAWFVLTGAASRSFDNAGDSINMGNVHDVTTGNISWSCWVNSTEDASTDFWLGKRTNVAANNAGYAIRQGSSDGAISIVGDGAAGVEETTPVVDTDGAWHYVLAIWDGSADTLEMYVDNSTDGSSTAATGSLTNALDLTIGESSSGANDANGLISMCSLWLSKLTAQQAIESSYFPERSGAIVDGLWPLWGQSPEIDMSLNNNTGTVAGASTSSDGPPLTFGSALPL